MVKKNDYTPKNGKRLYYYLQVKEASEEVKLTKEIQQQTSSNSNYHSRTTKK